MLIHWKPQPKQTKALKSNADEILFGGARGGGKTDAGQAWLLYDVEHPQYRALVIRRNFTDLSDWIDRAKVMFQPAGGKYVDDYFVFPSGAKIRTGHLADKEAYTKYQGHEYQKMLIEELSHIPKQSLYLKLIASCRSTVEGIKPQVFCTTNPDDPGLEWIKERWDIPDYPEFEKTYETVRHVDINGTKMTRRFAFIPSQLEDNPMLSNADPAYIVQLELLKETDPDLYASWRLGHWVGGNVEGSFYRRLVDVAVARGHVADGLYDPLQPVYTWCDIGKGENYAIAFFQRGINKWVCIDYEELVDDQGLHDGIRLLKSKPYIYAEHYAPHDMAVKDFSATESRYEIAKNLDVQFNILPMSGVQEGIDIVKLRFPSLWFEKSTTKNFLKRIRSYHKEYDEKRGVWKDNPVHDSSSHGADVLRYWGITKVDLPDYEFEQRVIQNRLNKAAFR